MNTDEKKPSLALTLASALLLVLNSLAATFGTLVVIFTRWELSKSGEKWGFIVLPFYCLGGLAVMVLLLIGTLVFVARVRASLWFRCLLILLILFGILFVISPFIPEFRSVTVPLVRMFE